MQYIPTKYNVADLFTKSVSKQVLQELLPVLLGYRAPPYPPRQSGVAPENKTNH